MLSQSGQTDKSQKILLVPSRGATSSLSVCPAKRLVAFLARAFLPKFSPAKKNCITTKTACASWESINSQKQADAARINGQKTEFRKKAVWSAVCVDRQGMTPDNYKLFSASCFGYPVKIDQSIKLWIERLPENRPGYSTKQQE